jgi:hypothetical protein
VWNQNESKHQIASQSATVGNPSFFHFLSLFASSPNQFKASISGSVVPLTETEALHLFGLAVTSTHFYISY